MKEAIQKAIIGGYGFRKTGKMFSEMLDEEHLLDPEFWQCLGKALGFEPKKVPETGRIYLTSPYGYALDKQVNWWEYTMHRFIDHLAEGKDVDEFFKDLLTN